MIITPNMTILKLKVTFDVVLNGNIVACEETFDSKPICLQLSGPKYDNISKLHLKDSSDLFTVDICSDKLTEITRQSEQSTKSLVVIQFKTSPKLPLNIGFPTSSFLFGFFKPIFRTFFDDFMKTDSHVNIKGQDFHIFKNNLWFQKKKLKILDPNAELIDQKYYISEFELGEKAVFDFKIPFN